MIHALQSRWMVPVLGSIVYFATTFALIRPERLAAAHESQEAETVRSQGLDPSWTFQNPELEQLVNELRHEKETLQQREQQLKALETRLQSERSNLAVITQAVHRLQKDFDQNVLRLKEEEAANYKKLGKLHAAMSPESAANVFREMPDDEVVKIISYMKVDEVSGIFDALGRLGKSEAKRVATLTDRMRRTLTPAPSPAKNTP
jgi:flagellar motility protein MotE (MotC chaperone)